jgi:anti-sigma factor RsiW
MTMTCEQALPLLSAYFDRELDVTKSLEIEGHVRECARCAAALQRHEALRASLRGAALEFAPPSALEWRVRQAVRREARPRRSSVLLPLRWAAVPVAATVAAVLSWSVATQHGRSSGENIVLAELVSGHVRSLMADHLVDVATSDQHTVKPWFNGKIDFAPPVMDFTASGFPLVGGRVDYIAGRPVAVVVYKRRQHVVNVFIWPSGNEAGQGLRTSASEGYHLLRWTRSGLTFWAVSDVNAADLETLAGLFRDAEETPKP